MMNCSQSSSDDAVVINRDDISNYNPEHILPESPEDIKNIRKWLQATEYTHESGEFRKHLASHMDGTGTWLTSSGSFRRWLDGHDHGMLWIKGIPGSGKSVVAAHLVDLLTRSNPGVPVLYFFFRQIIDANHEPAALLRDWLDQVLEYSPPLQKRLKELVETQRSMSSLSMDDLWKYLQLAFTGLPDKVFCVADALDEMDEGNREFLEALAALGQSKPGKVKVLVTSRLVSRVEEPFRKANMLRIRLEENMVDMDIASYIERSLEASSIPIEKQHLIREAIPGHANGIFLYAKLAMDAFLEPGAHAEDVLRTLPADLHDMYTNLLHDHRVRSGMPDDIQLLILQCVTHATRPLRLIELAEMIRVTYRSTDHPDAGRDLRSTKNLVRTAAGPLLEILPDETVCVIHHSFTEYLKCMTRSEMEGGYPILHLGSTHGRLALACLAYLQAGCLDTVNVRTAGDHDSENSPTAVFESVKHRRFYGRKDQDVKEQQQVRLQYPFFAYATANWHIHVTRSCAVGFPQDGVSSALHQFLKKGRRMKAWLKLHWAEIEEGSNSVTSLHIAARYGLTQYARELVSEQVDVNAGDIYGKTPMWWAATGGHADIIQLLVQAGADSDADDKVQGLKPLHEAANKNHAEVVRALMEAGVDPLTPKTRENPGRRCGNAPTSRGHTPLMYACHNGHLEALNAFLPFLTDIDTVHRALAWSAARGRSKLVRRLLQYPGIDVNAKVRGDTALYLACETADRDTIVALLHAGADPTVLCSASSDEFGGMGWARYWGSDMVEHETKGFTALYALCNVTKRRCPSSQNVDPEALQDLFCLLLQRGANVDQRTYDGSTALHAAIASPVLTRLLLRAGADANAADDSGRTPLHVVRSPESVALLVEEGQADIDKTISSDGRSPLLCMLDESHKEVILKLLEYRPNLTIKDKKGNGPLHITLTQWNTDTTIIEELLAAGTDPNERNRAGETPLLAMRMDHRDSVTMVDILLKAGANINAKDPSGMTVLFRTMGGRSLSGSSDHSDIKGLLDKGADLHVRDYKGRTLLHHALAKHEGTRAYVPYGQKLTTRFDFILSLGLDLQALDYCGNSLVHEIAMRSDMLDSSGLQYIPLWQQLLALGVDINQENLQGRTVLHILAATQSLGFGAPMYKVGHFGPLDLVIAKVKNINQCDHRGLTALHLASTVSEHTTKKLLDAGADPTLPTLEGLTPLHLAARTRQSNTVGLLLNSGKSHSTAEVDARDEKGNTPLYYACRSGRAETVRLLLDAGADASQKTLFLACAALEEEERLWNQPRHEADTQANQSASGLTLYDQTRPVATGRNYHQSNDLDTLNDTIRLEEIVSMLVDYRCDPSSLMESRSHGGIGALDTAANAGHDYTFGCLLEAFGRLSGQAAVSTTVTLYTEQAVRAYKDAQISIAVNFAHLITGKANQNLIIQLLKKRQYHVVRSLFDNGVNFLAEDGHCYGTNLELFVGHGYASLLDEIGTLEAERQLKEGKWHAFGDKAKPGLYVERSLEAGEEADNPPLLLLTALRRSLPNMEVVRLLVEKFHVDVNQCRYERVRLKSGKFEMAPHETALHYLANGTHWWHSALAMPYLVSKGANIDARDNTGCTPLHIALGGPDRYVGSFSKDTVRVLVAAGADLDAQDNDGRSCLASTAGDVEMVHLLIEHGASIHADSLFMAIDGKKVDVLKALLSTGVDANMRLEAPQPSSRNRRAQPGSIRDTSAHEVYPLYAAATKHSAGYRSLSAEEKRRDSREAVQLVTALLASGADPFATFKRRNPEFRKERDEDAEDEIVRALLLGDRTSDAEFEDVTILHDLLEANELVHPILDFATLDTNRRDAKGRTLLHVACHNSHGISAPVDSLFASSGSEFKSSLPSYLDCLLARGAELLATDHKGRNILHHMFEANERRQSSDRDMHTLTYLTTSYPTLINQADVHGKTPLDLALKHAVLQCDVAPAQVLLDVGADPFSVDDRGNSPLHILSFRIYESRGVRCLFAKLIDRNLDINARNNGGETPIFNLNKHIPGGIAFFSNNDEFTSTTEALSLFEKAGADLFARDNEGRGLLHIAAKETVEIKKDNRFPGLFQTSESKPAERSTTRFEILMQKGLDPLMEDSQKRTALDIAVACGKESILKLFKKDIPSVE